MFDLIDAFKEVCTKAHAKNCGDVEMEAIASAYLGHIYYLVQKNSKRAMNYYRDCLRMIRTLVPKTFNDQKWYQDLMKYYNEIS